MPAFASSGTCPCGNAPYDACCGPLLRNERQADTPEELMRSRYSAYAVHATDHLFRTWHPRTRPEDVSPDEHLTWTGLEVLDAPEPGPGTGIVEFRAHWLLKGGTWSEQSGTLHERSRFEKRAGRWVYVDGDGVED